MNDATLPTPLNQIPVNFLNSPGKRLENKISSLQGATGAKQTAELKKVSQEFESIFIAHLLKVMRETIEDSGLLGGGFGKSIYTELFDQEVSLSLARRGTLGISDLLYQSLAKKAENAEKQEAAPSPDVGPSDNNPDVAPKPSDGHPVSEDEISDMQLPVLAPISSPFGTRRDPFTHEAKRHKGVDLAAPEGMKVVPAYKGTVVFAGYMNGYGNAVIVQHSGELQTRYGHLGSIGVRAGDTVDSQNILGTVGSTGRSTGPHLHFEVIRNGAAVNPTAHLNASISSARSERPKTGV